MLLWFLALLVYLDLGQCYKHFMSITYLLYQDTLIDLQNILLEARMQPLVGLILLHM